MCTLFSIFSRQPYKFKPIIKFVFWYPIEQRFVPACSIAWEKNYFCSHFCDFQTQIRDSPLNIPLYRPLLQPPNFVALQCIDTGAFWILEYRTEQCTHCALWPKSVKVGGARNRVFL